MTLSLAFLIEAARCIADWRLVQEAGVVADEISAELDEAVVVVAVAVAIAVAAAAVAIRIAAQYQFVWPQE